MKGIERRRAAFTLQPSPFTESAHSHCDRRSKKRIFLQTYGWPLFWEHRTVRAERAGVSAETVLVFQALAEGVQVALAGQKDG